MSESINDNPYLRGAIDHFKKLEVKAIGIPEWPDPETGEPLVIYCKPFKVGERMQIERFGRNNSMWEVFIETLILKALKKNEDGSYSPMFTKKDKLILKNHVDSDVIARVVGTMREFMIDEDGDLAGE